MRTYKVGQAVVVTVNGGAIEGTILDISLCSRTLVVSDVSGAYFVPLDNIDYIQTLGSTDPKSQIRAIQKVCDKPSSGGAAAVAI
jgi:hypothetical protein